MSKENIINAAVSYMMEIANDAAHGYDQANRWGPDYDCSSLVITAYDNAGTGVKAAGATYTGNMKRAFLKCGFSDVTGSVSLSSGSGLQYGDVLLNETHHTAMFIGDGKLAQASINERGGITGGQTGDQTGGEINIRGYYNFPWNVILRYTKEDSAEAPVSTPVAGIPVSGITYTVVRGDTLWGISQKYGISVADLVSWNGIANPALIYPGQVLKLTLTTSATSGAEPLPELSKGDTGGYVVKAQKALIAKGCSLPAWGADGDFGSETESAVKKFQQDHGLEVDGVVGVNTWAALLS